MNESRLMYCRLSQCWKNMLNFSFPHSDFEKKFKQKNTWNKNHIYFYSKLGDSMNRLQVFVEKIGK